METFVYILKFCLQIKINSRSHLRVQAHLVSNNTTFNYFRSGVWADRHRGMVHLMSHYFVSDGRICLFTNWS